MFKPFKDTTLRGHTALARWHATHDLTNLGYPSDKLPRNPYSYSMLTPVFVDAHGIHHACIVETTHAKYEVWAVPSEGCAEDIS
jgi:hypothetical protein